jgi:hypothetical protein
MQRVKYPRALITRFNRGETMGPHGDHDTQVRVLRTALELLCTAAPGEIRSWQVNS